MMGKGKAMQERTCACWMVFVQAMCFCVAAVLTVLVGKIVCNAAS